MIKSFLVFLLFLSTAIAGIPVDIVFDIDLTIISPLPDEAAIDFLRDPANPKKGTFDITFDRPELDDMNRPILDANGVPKSTRVTEAYRKFDGMTDLMQELKRLQKEGLVRISFFSGGSDTRNLELLKNIQLQDGTTLYDLVVPERIFSRSHESNWSSTASTDS